MLSTAALPLQSASLAGRPSQALPLRLGSRLNDRCMLALACRVVPCGGIISTARPRQYLRLASHRLLGGRQRQNDQEEHRECSQTRERLLLKPSPQEDLAERSTRTNRHDSPNHIRS
eukprot:TRINITY_DN94550_c0_g1_i1.p2 TRINITY_DN94550_c0_g1~~TRINITY_DN94550_c0_g1_i1.p2  ORF type:complete len:117 (-),score=7.55 TRINITY_DN94550_c0_g1_i1:49-399(-)